MPNVVGKSRSLPSLTWKTVRWLPYNYYTNQGVREGLLKLLISTKHASSANCKIDDNKGSQKSQIVGLFLKIEWILNPQISRLFRWIFQNRVDFWPILFNLQYCEFKQGGIFLEHTSALFEDLLYVKALLVSFLKCYSLIHSSGKK